MTSQLEKKRLYAPKHNIMWDCVCVLNIETDNSAIVLWEIHHLVIVRFTVQKRGRKQEKINETIREEK